MKRWQEYLLHHWRAKLVSLAIAIVVWLVLRHAVVSSPAEPPLPATPTPRASG